MKIPLYTRDEQGLVRYHGDHDYDSREQVLEYYSRASEPAEVENMAGWPHSRVTWHGNIGFGETGTDEKPILFAIIQVGQCVFGAGSTRDEAYADAARSLDGEWTAERVQAECVARPVDGDLMLIDSDHPEFDGYMRNQGYEQRDGRWY